MKKIDNKKHNRLLHCLEELCALTCDTEDVYHIRMDIATLTAVYERYVDFLSAVEVQALRYHSVYRDIQVGVYKQLRVRKRKRAFLISPPARE